MFIAWPFTKWGLDIVEPLKWELNSKTFLLVTKDYFSKWIEFKVLATITTQDVRRFMWEDIIYMFVLPYTLVLDNGKQFDVQEITTLCFALGIRHNFLEPYHPQVND